MNLTRQFIGFEMRQPYSMKDSINTVDKIIEFTDKQVNKDKNENN